jgi:uncharacterized membrane-anchored protein
MEDAQEKLSIWRQEYNTQEATYGFGNADARLLRRPVASTRNASRSLLGTSPNLTPLVEQKRGIAQMAIVIPALIARVAPTGVIRLSAGATLVAQ